MKQIFKLVTTASAALLVACGGGGGGQTAATPASPASPAVPLSTAATLVTSVPPASYTGQAAIASAVWNAERSQCGFGLLSQNPALDGAAAAHASYSVISGTVAHEEISGQPGFTGETPASRIAVKGYAGTGSTVSEVMTGVNGAILSSAGNYAIRSLLSAPYHLRAMVDSYRDVGMAFGNGSVGSPFVGDLGYQTAASPQLIAGSDVKTYPCDGSAGVFPELRSETPNPVPGRDLAINPIGTPVLVRVRDGNTLVVKTTSMVQLSNGAAIPLRPTVTAANDPNRVNGIGYIRANEAYFAPDSALAPNSQYQVTVTGTNNGVDFSRTFIFTTGIRG
ncbi:MAG: CAP domain-containing protein [Candidatus Saccharibacteria bacterium]|nr:CAP domain-containing protein [Rhodoferax sp.]